MFRRHELPHVEFSPRLLFRTLTEQDVSFVFVGMGAGYPQGAPYPTTNADVTPRPDQNNLEKLEQALRMLQARPLEHDDKGPVEEPWLPGFRRLMTSAGMVNMVDALPGGGSYERLKERADLMELTNSLSVWVAALEDVIRSKETVQRSRPIDRTLDTLHVLMRKETLRAKKRYGL